MNIVQCAVLLYNLINDCNIQDYRYLCWYRLIIHPYPNNIFFFKIKVFDVTCNWIVWIIKIRFKRLELHWRHLKIDCREAWVIVQSLFSLFPCNNLLYWQVINKIHMKIGNWKMALVVECETDLNLVKGGCRLLPERGKKNKKY